MSLNSYLGEEKGDKFINIKMVRMCNLQKQQCSKANICSEDICSFLVARHFEFNHTNTERTGNET